MSIRTTVPLQDLINDPHALEKAVRDETVSLDDFLADPKGTFKKALSKQVIINDPITGYYLLVGLDPSSIKLPGLLGNSQEADAAQQAPEQNQTPGQGSGSQSNH